MDKLIYVTKDDEIINLSPSPEDGIKNISDLENDVGYITESDIPKIPSKVSELDNDSDFLTEGEVQSKINTALTSVYKYKGSVANKAALPSDDNAIGDVYDTQDTGMNYGWNGTEWDALGALVSGGYTKPEGGVPRTDLAEDVQESLEKADTALQSETQPDWSAETGAAAILNKPTKLSDFNNDVGFITADNLPDDLGSTDVILCSRADFENMSDDRKLGKFFILQDDFVLEEKDEHDYPQELLTLINNERIKNNLSELVWNDDVEAASAIRAQELSELFSNTRPTGRPWSTVLKNASAECIAKDHKDAQSVFNEWMSSNLKNNLLTSTSTKVGISIYIDDNENWYWHCLIAY